MYNDKDKERVVKAAHPIRLVVGGQWGSEAKGAVAAALCQIHNIDYAVRTGGVNAGHTVYHWGKPFRMQQLPTGWTNPGTDLVIGPGAYINPEILDREMAMLEEINIDVVERLHIDYRAGLHTSAHTEKSKASGRHHAMGATGKGCSEAVIDRIRNRGNTDDESKRRTIFGAGYGDISTYDTEELLNGAYDNGKSILIEGTQGQLLDLLLGPWPYVTHKPTSPAQWLVETGLSPSLKIEVIMAARTYPIRVAGNSGPMPNEIDWVTFARQHSNIIDQDAVNEFEAEVGNVATQFAMEGKLPRYTDTNIPNFRFSEWSADMRRIYAATLSEFHAEVMARLPKRTVDVLSQLFEFTTVTKKLRRIAAWDTDTMRTSVRQVRPNYIVLTFLNYVFPELWGMDEAEEIHDKAMRYVKGREEELGVEIRYVTTGPETRHMIDISGR